MNHANQNKFLIPLAAAGFGLRYFVYRYAVDAKNLVVTTHPLVVALWVLTAVTALFLLLSLRHLEEDPVWFPNGNAAFLSHGLLAVGMFCTVWLNASPTAGLLGILWKVLGFSGAAGLLWAGFDRLRGKEPFFGCYALVCLFALVHVVVHYQRWCSNPQLTDYGFDLLGTVALSFLSYHLSAHPLGLAGRKVPTFAAGSLLFCYAVAMANGAYPYLNLGGWLFALTCLPGISHPKEG